MSTIQTCSRCGGLIGCYLSASPDIRLCACVEVAAPNKPVAGYVTTIDTCSICGSKLLNVPPRLQSQATEKQIPRVWHVAKRWCGHSNSMSQLRTVLVLGRWSVSGSTGCYVVTGPDGWDVERKDPFKTEDEAKRFVESQNP